jgi:hypothetical protein
MSIFPTHPPVPKVHPWKGAAFVAKIAELFAWSCDQRGHQLVPSAAKVDVALYLEPNCWKDRDYGELRSREKNIRQFPEKCFANRYADFAIQVPEKDASRLPEILRPHQERAAEMGRLARREWQTWFAPDVVVPRFIICLSELAAAQPKTAPDYGRLWRSWGFYAPYGLAPHQKLWKNLRDGALLRKVAKRLGLANP